MVHRIENCMICSSLEPSLATRDPSSQQTPIGKDASIMSLLIGRLGRRPISVLAADDPVTCAMYAKENDILHIDGWKRFRNLAKRDKTLMRAVMQSRIRQARRAKKYMFGYHIPRSYKDASEFDKENNNTKWFDATREAMDCIKEQQVFIKHQRVKWDSNHKQIINAPPNHQKIRINLIFALKHDGRHKARLVADGFLTPKPLENIYSEVVSLGHLRLVIFLGELNNLEL